MKFPVHNRKGVYLQSSPREVTRRVLRSDRGAIGIILAFCMSAILLGIGFASLNLGLANDSLNSLQSAADSAASAGVSAFCSGRVCYERARATALEFLSHQKAQSSIGANSSLDVTDISVPSDQYIWDKSSSSNLVVTVERGRWIPASSPDEGEEGTPEYQFESLEGDWQTKHPGVPNYLVANALKVTIKRPETSFLPAAFGGQSYSLERSSIAVKGSTDDAVEIAPFALPVCAVINNGGNGNSNTDYYGESSSNELCRGDRIFTRADRFESASLSPFYPTGFGVPSFAYQAPVSKSILFEPGNRFHRWDTGIMLFEDPAELQAWVAANGGVYTPAGGLTGPAYATVSGYSDSYSWFYAGTKWGTSGPGGMVVGLDAWGFGGKPSFPQPGESEASASNERGDAYGVVGLPNTPAENVQDSIADALAASGTPKWAAKVGDSFSILPEGLTDPSFNDLIWNKITDPTNTSPGDHLPLSESPMETIEKVYGAFQAHLGLRINDLSYPTSQSCSSWTWNTYSGPDGCKVDPNFDANNAAQQALLNTNGTQWIMKEGASAEGLCNSKWARFSNFKLRDLPPGSTYSTDGFLLDAQVSRESGISDSTKVWAVNIPIIGDFAENAIGCHSRTEPNAWGAPALPFDSSVDPNGNYQIVGFVKGYIYDVDVGQTLPNVEFDYAPGIKHSVVNWGFQSGQFDSGDPYANQCNVVRGRLACERAYLGSSDMNPDADARIVQ